MMPTNANNNGNSRKDSDDINDKVLQLLRQQGIKLWRDPFLDNQQQPVHASLENLVDQWDHQGLLARHNLRAHDDDDDDDDKSAIVQSLKQWQSHALAKLQAKQPSSDNNQTPATQGSASPNTEKARLKSTTTTTLTLQIKVLGQRHSELVLAASSSNETPETSMATHVEIMGNDDNEKPTNNDNDNSVPRKGPVVLRFQGVSANRTDKELLRCLANILQTPILNLIHKGKRMEPAGLTLGHYVFPTTTTTTTTTTANSSNPNNLTTNNNDNVVVVDLLCMASSDSDSAIVVADKNNYARTQHATLHARIAAIRTAARQVMQHASTQLEITDQHGVTVPMRQDDRLGFVTALALHRMGLRYCHNSGDSNNNNNSNNNNKSDRMDTDASQQNGNDNDNDNDSHHQTKEECLVLLLEADAEWNSHPNLQPWSDRVDNYGLLQLDIAWLYLQLESLSNLPDSLRRLEEAERVLRKQVHVNFVTLALTQAEMGNFKEVPPLSAVFAKLFLLQGIAYLYDSQNNSVTTSSSSLRKCKERLDQAFQLLQSLRSLAPEDSVDRLLEMMGSSTGTVGMEEDLPLYDCPTNAGAHPRMHFTRSDAIAALRKCQGNLDAAANMLSEDAALRQQRQHDRDVQHRHGLCENETDPVNLVQLETLKSMLGGLGGAAADAEGRDAVDGMATDLAVGLLRLANNQLTKALEIYKEQDYDSTKIQALVDDLDHRLAERGLIDKAVLARKKRRKVLFSKQRPVDEVALATLLSMGVDQTRALHSLQKSGNDVERAIRFLFGSSASDNGVPGEGSLDEPGTVAALVADGSDVMQGREEAGGSFGTDGTAPTKGSTPDSSEQEEAQELLYQELGDILEERNLEKEFLGNSLDNEWRLVLKYRPTDGLLHNNVTS